jgi:hypothetical protein
VRAVPLVALVVALAGCAGGGDDDGGGETDESGCPIPVAAVGDVLGYAVVVDGDHSEATCRFVPDEVAADEHPGAHVLVVVRTLAGNEDGASGYDIARSAVEDSAGGVDDLPEGAVDGAARGWVATLGRVAQVGAADGDRLVQVTVADPAADAPAARAIGFDLAGQVLG